MPSDELVARRQALEEKRRRIEALKAQKAERARQAADGGLGDGLEMAEAPGRGKANFAAAADLAGGVPRERRRSRRVDERRETPVRAILSKSPMLSRAKLDEKTVPVTRVEECSRLAVPRRASRRLRYSSTLLRATVSSMAASAASCLRSSSFVPIFNAAFESLRVSRARNTCEKPPEPRRSFTSYGPTVSG